MSIDAVRFRSPEPGMAAAFWAVILGRTAVPLGEDLVLPGSPRQLGLRFAVGDGHPATENRLHLHLTYAGRAQADTIAAAVSLGGRVAGSGNIPPGSFAVMADAVGDEFCVIEDDNAYLAGCGPLGEVTIEGTVAVAEFWAAVLDWPVVWSEGDERAIQSPGGGTKLAWSGDAVEPDRTNERQEFVLTVPAAEYDVEVARLQARGATGPEANADRVEMRDPDGVAFELRAI